MTLRAAALSITAALTFGALAGCAVQPADENTSAIDAELTRSSIASIASAKLCKGA